MELKKYFDDLRELTKTGQVKWIHRTNSPVIYDFVNESKTLTASLIYDHVSIRAVITYPNPNINSLQIQSELRAEGLYKEGDTYKALAKLWDQVVIIHSNKVVDILSSLIPKVDTKIKFGPKDKSNERI